MVHLLRGLEELGRAGVAALELAAERWDGPSRKEVREILQREVDRWEVRASDDPAAARVRDLFVAVRDVLDEDPR